MTVQPPETTLADAHTVAVSTLTTLCLVLSELYTTKKTDLGRDTNNFYVSAIHQLDDYDQSKENLKFTLMQKFPRTHQEWAEQVCNNLLVHWNIPPF
jgi:hypothetical protein